MKTCSVCKESKPLSDFHRRRNRPGGYASRCKTCKAVAATAYYEKNKESCRAKCLAWHYANKEKSISRTKAWQAANAEAYKAVKKAWRSSRAKERSDYFRDWSKENRDLISRNRAHRRAALKLATVAWADQKAIRAVYARALRLTMETGQEHVVDHIVPLQSAVVCGIHVEHNLRAIPLLENSSKGNRWWPDMPGEIVPDRAPDLSRAVGG